MDDDEMLRRSLEESGRNTDPLMAVCLSFAVPLWIDVVRKWTPDMRMVHAHAAGQMICYGAGAADVATGGRERRGKKGGKKAKKGTPKKPREGAAEVFNSIACGLAILAYCPGGVTWGGSHWEAK